MPYQSEFVGPVAFPSPLVSPPTVPSRHDVNTTGLAAVPEATNEPWTRNWPPQFWPPLTTVPAPNVTVTDGATVTAEHPPHNSGMRVPVHGRLELTVTTSLDNVTELNWLPEPEFPFNFPKSMFAL